MRLTEAKVQLTAEATVHLLILLSHVFLLCPLPRQGHIVMQAAGLRLSTLSDDRFFLSPPVHVLFVLMFFNIQQHLNLNVLYEITPVDGNTCLDMVLELSCLSFVNS